MADTSSLENRQTLFLVFVTVMVQPAKSIFSVRGMLVNFDGISNSISRIPT